MSYAQEDYADAEIRNGVSGALALRYVAGSAVMIQPFIAGGGWLTRDASLEFERSYDNGSGTATGR